MAGGKEIRAGGAYIDLRALDLIGEGLDLDAEADKILDRMEKQPPAEPPTDAT